MNGANCQGTMNTQQDNRFFLAGDQYALPGKKVGIHIVRNEDMDSIYHEHNSIDDACEEIHGNTVHFIS